MADSKISQLTALTTAADDDLLAIVDTSATETKKIAKSDLVAGLQAELVSGTNIKTINSTSLLGSGNISIAANPAGTAGQIQFSDGSAFAADSNLFWDNTNKVLNVGYGNDGKITLKGTASVAEFTGGRQVRIGSGGGNPIFIEPSGGSGVGINFSNTNPSAMLHVKGSGSTSATTSLLVQNSSGTELMKTGDSGTTRISNGGNGQYLEVNSGNYLITNLYAQYHDSTNVQFRSAITSFVVGSNTSISSALVNIDSTTKGFLPPRMTTTQKNAISTPALGLQVVDTTTSRPCVYTTAWESLTSSDSASPTAVYKFWSGTAAQYAALTPDSNTVYFVS